MTEARPTDLERRLPRVEEALERCERMALASRYAGAIMHEVNNPLEAIINLVYLTKTQKNDPGLVSENMEIVEQQLAILSQVTSQALTFHCVQTEATDWELVEIAESALKLHTEKIARHRITVKSRFQRPAVTRAFGTDILQVISNLLLNAMDALPRENGRIAFRVRKRGQSVHIVISDNGRGMPGTVAARIFDALHDNQNQRDRARSLVIPNASSSNTTVHCDSGLLRTKVGAELHSVSRFRRRQQARQRPQLRSS